MTGGVKRLRFATAGDRASSLNLTDVTLLPQELDACRRLVRRCLGDEEAAIEQVLEALGVAPA